jgi:hypothetical protein
MLCMPWYATPGTHDVLRVLVKPFSSESCVLSCWLQVYRGSYGTEAEAARAHDWAALAYSVASGMGCQTNVSWTAAILHLLLQPP